jgi:hypothetical protein
MVISQTAIVVLLYLTCKPVSEYWAWLKHLRDRDRYNDADFTKVPVEKTEYDELVGLI